MVKKRLMAFALSICMVLAPALQAGATVSSGDAENAGTTSASAPNDDEIGGSNSAVTSNEELGGVFKVTV